MINRRVVIIGAMLAVLLCLNCTKSKKVTLCGGIVTQSGDVKPLARTKFLVYSASPLPYVLALRDSAKVDLNYDADYKGLEAELDEVIKLVHNSKELKALRVAAKDIIVSLYSDENYSLEKNLRDFELYTQPTGSVHGQSAPEFWEEWVKEMRGFAVELQEIVERHRRIGRLRGEEDTDDSYGEYQKAIDKIDIFPRKIFDYRLVHRRISSKHAEFSALDDKLQMLWHAKSAAYLLHQPHLMLTTSLAGEAAVELKLGTNWILIATNIGHDNRMVWAIELEVTKETDFFEFSNDNAYVCSDSLLSSDDLYAILNSQTTVSYASSTIERDSTAITSGLGSTAKYRAAEAEAALGTIRSALRVKYAEDGAYPTSSDGIIWNISDIGIYSTDLIGVFFAASDYEYVYVDDTHFYVIARGSAPEVSDVVRTIDQNGTITNSVP